MPNQNSVIKIKKLTQMGYYYLIDRLDSDFAKLPNFVLCNNKRRHCVGGPAPFLFNPEPFALCDFASVYISEG